MKNIGLRPVPLPRTEAILRVALARFRRQLMELMTAEPEEPEEPDEPDESDESDESDDDALDVITQL
ncbi:hypothetical protein NUW58_g10844 [Xylaria curta]|uniref:Uncharacterized protein n=1 Tax=Xylaria curta TaxID=42375 RepID=A0ACC1MFZ7_9PEZI|nr:hypothetical protein NUW58_g10844 [Xylaria curta]